MMPEDSFASRCVRACTNLCVGCVEPGSWYEAGWGALWWQGEVWVSLCRPLSWRSSWAFKLHSSRWAFPCCTCWVSVVLWPLSCQDYRVPWSLSLLLSPFLTFCLDPLFSCTLKPSSRIFFHKTPWWPNQKEPLKQDYESLATEEITPPFFAVKRLYSETQLLVVHFLGKIVLPPAHPRMCHM